MPNNFERRLQPAIEFEAELIALLARQPNIVRVGRNGTEHTHSEFMDSVRFNESPAALELRFAPDGIAVEGDGSIFRFDAKVSKSIERRAYDAYMRISRSICRVVVFVKHGESILSQEIQKLELVPAEETVSRFPIHQRFPIVDGWISPRKRLGFQSTSVMSGTDYREIYLATMDVFHSKVSPNAPVPALTNRMQEDFGF